MKKVMILLLLGCLQLGFVKVYSEVPFALMLVPAGKGTLPETRGTSFSSADYPEVLETKKIKYLLERIQASPYTFTKGGGIEAPAKLAFLYLREKYARSARDIRTAKEFIEKIATRSEMTDETYYVKISETELYPLNDVLYNELFKLESLLWVKSSSA